MVVRNRGPVTKDRAKSLIASGLQRAVMNHGLEDVASAATCSPRCLQKALAHETMPEAHTLANILLLDPNVLCEFFGALGFQIVPREMEMSPDMQTLHLMCKSMAEFTDALRDGKRNHRETLELADELRPLIPRLTAIVHEAEGLKAA